MALTIQDWAAIQAGRNMAEAYREPFAEAFPDRNPKPTSMALVPPGIRGEAGAAGQAGPAGMPPAPSGGQMVFMSAPMELGARTTGEEFRRGYSTGGVTANQYRASLGFQDVGARRGAMQIREARDDFSGRLDRSARAATERMRVQSEMARPIPLQGGGFVQMRRDGSLDVQYPPAQPARPPDPVVLNPGQVAMNPQTGQTIGQAPAAQTEPRILPPGAVMVQDGQTVASNPQVQQPSRAEPHYGPVVMDEKSGMVGTWNPRGGQFGEGGYDWKPAGAGGITVPVNGQMVTIGGSQFPTNGIPKVQGMAAPAAAGQGAVQHGPAVYKRTLADGSVEYKDASGVTWK